jgi:hypothetical protein
LGRFFAIRGFPEIRGSQKPFFTSVALANLLDSRVANYDLWLLDQSNPADPNTAQPPAAPYPTATGSFNNRSFWQYSGSGAEGAFRRLIWMW